MAEEKRGRGRPRKYSADVAEDGAPKLSVRLDPELLAWVKVHHGGAGWVRQIVARLHGSGMATALDQVEFHRRIQKLVAGAFREAKRAHAEVDPGSVGKRVASQLWADMALPEVDKPVLESGH